MFLYLMTDEPSGKTTILEKAHFSLKIFKLTTSASTFATLLTTKANMTWKLNSQVALCFYRSFNNVTGLGLPNPAVFKSNVTKDEDSTTSYTLIWKVLSFTPIIEYSLLFREFRPDKDSVRYDWTKLTIPSDSTSAVVHSMLYTIKGLKAKTTYEALVMSRNKYGWSKHSSILRFRTKGGNCLSSK